MLLKLTHNSVQLRSPGIWKAFMQPRVHSWTCCKVRFLSFGILVLKWYMKVNSPCWRYYSQLHCHLWMASNLKVSSFSYQSVKGAQESGFFSSGRQLAMHMHSKMLGTKIKWVLSLPWVTQNNNTELIILGPLASYWGIILLQINTCNLNGIWSWSATEAVTVASQPRRTHWILSSLLHVEVTSLL